MNSRWAEARVGTWLRDKYRIEATLGEGGMAVVYAATHRNKKRVAVKGGKTSTLASAEDHPAAVVADATSVYWTNQGRRVS
jgi:serine/threonine protein kinase